MPTAPGSDVQYPQKALVLAVINGIREHYRKRLLTAIPCGRRHAGHACPIWRALRNVRPISPTDAQWSGAYGLIGEVLNDAAIDDGRAEILKRFIAGFDNGAYPDLDETLIGG